MASPSAETDEVMDWLRAVEQLHGFPPLHGEPGAGVGSARAAVAAAAVPRAEEGVRRPAEVAAPPPIVLEPPASVKELKANSNDPGNIDRARKKKAAVLASIAALKANAADVNSKLAALKLTHPLNLDALVTKVTDEVALSMLIRYGEQVEAGRGQFDLAGAHVVAVGPKGVAALNWFQARQPLKAVKEPTEPTAPTRPTAPARLKHEAECNGAEEYEKEKTRFAADQKKFEKAQAGYTRAQEQYQRAQERYPVDRAAYAAYLAEKTKYDALKTSAQTILNKTTGTTDATGEIAAAATVLWNGFKAQPAALGSWYAEDETRFEEWVAEAPSGLRLTDLGASTQPARDTIAMVRRGVLRGAELGDVYQSGGDLKAQQFSFSVRFPAVAGLVIHSHCTPDVAPQALESEVASYTLAKAHVKSAADERRTGASFDLPTGVLDKLLTPAQKGQILRRINELRLELFEGGRHVIRDERHNITEPVPEGADWRPAVDRWKVSLLAGRVADLFRTVPGLPGHWVQIAAEIGRISEASVTALAERMPPETQADVWVAYGQALSEVREGILAAARAARSKLTVDAAMLGRIPEADRTGVLTFGVGRLAPLTYEISTGGGLVVY